MGTMPLPDAIQNSSWSLANSSKAIFVPPTFACRQEEPEEDQDGEDVHVELHDQPQRDTAAKEPQDGKDEAAEPENSCENNVFEGEEEEHLEQDKELELSDQESPKAQDEKESTAAEAKVETEQQQQRQQEHEELEKQQVGVEKEQKEKPVEESDPAESDQQQQQAQQQQQQQQNGQRQERVGKQDKRCASRSRSNEPEPKQARTDVPETAHKGLRMQQAALEAACRQSNHDGKHATDEDCRLTNRCRHAFDASRRTSRVTMGAEQLPTRPDGCMCARVCAIIGSLCMCMHARDVYAYTRMYMHVHMHHEHGAKDRKPLVANLEMEDAAFARRADEMMQELSDTCARNEDLVQARNQ